MHRDEEKRARAYRDDIEDGAAVPHDLMEEGQRGTGGDPSEGEGLAPRSRDESTVGDMHGLGDGAGLRTHDPDSDDEARRLDAEARLHANEHDD